MNKHTSKPFSICLALMLMSMMFVGCSNEQRESLHENDHFVAEHWPSSLADAAAKIEARVVMLKEEENEQAMNELFDIVGWVPEIAADSELTEEDWIPIHHASDALSSKLAKGVVSASGDSMAEVESFHRLLIERIAILDSLQRSKPGYEETEESIR